MNRRLLVSTTVIALTTVAVWAYPTYRSTGGAEDNCSQCHPGFIGGFSGPLHQLHLGTISECNACHTIPGSTPAPIKWEPGQPGCSGCHVVDGLVAHHTNAGAPPDSNGLACATCHPAVDPGPESDIPPFYPGGVDALSSVAGVLDPCDATDPDPNEDLDGDGSGLDNDGDLAYDEADPDCVVMGEPTELQLSKDEPEFTWNVAAGAPSYDLIRGLLSNLQLLFSVVDLGPVVCIEAASVDTQTERDENDPSPGDGFFYLVRSHGIGGTYGSSSGGLERVPASGDCPLP